MFIQTIEGRAKDADALREQMERWDRDLKPGAQGFLGATAGVSPDGVFFAAARFESEDAAQRNSDRPEQGEWWEETARHLEGDVTFNNFANAETSLGGGSDDAGFVQVMKGRTKDVQRSIDIGREFDKALPDLRPDVIGGLNCWLDDGRFVSISYFTSEAEAREGERKELSGDAKEMFQEWMSLVEDVQYIDLPDPWLTSR